MPFVVFLIIQMQRKSNYLLRDGSVIQTIENTTHTIISLERHNMQNPKGQ